MVDERLTKAKRAEWRSYPDDPPPFKRTMDIVLWYPAEPTGFAMVLDRDQYLSETHDDATHWRWLKGPELRDDEAEARKAGPGIRSGHGIAAVRLLIREHSGEILPMITVAGLIEEAIWTLSAIGFEEPP